MVLRARIVAVAIRLSLTALSYTVIEAGPHETHGAELRATWVDNSGGSATTRLERRVGTGSSFLPIADVPPGTSAYTDTSVSAGQTYCYRAQAYSASAVSQYSAEACATAASPTVTTMNIAVRKAGTGGGLVMSTPSGMSCDPVCALSFTGTSSVILRAAPAAGSIFMGWSGGGCAGTSNCTLVGTATVTATFAADSTAMYVGSFTLINADTNQPVPGFDPIHEGAVIDLQKLSTRRLNVRANTSPAVVASVRFGLNSNSNYRIENVAPYTLHGDSNGDYFAWTPAVGAYVLSATAYTRSGAGGAAGPSLLRRFSVVDSSTTTSTSTVSGSSSGSLAVSSLTLLDAATGRPVPGFDPLPEGATLDPRALPRSLAVRANTIPAQVGSIRFGYNGNVSYRTENVAPYALHGDTNGTYSAWTPQPGTYEVVATPYSGANATGTRGAALIRRFTVLQH